MGAHYLLKFVKRNGKPFQGTEAVILDDPLERNLREAGVRDVHYSLNLSSDQQTLQLDVDERGDGSIGNRGKIISVLDSFGYIQRKN